MNSGFLLIRLHERQQTAKQFRLGTASSTRSRIHSRVRLLRPTHLSHDLRLLIHLDREGRIDSLRVFAPRVAHHLKAAMEIGEFGGEDAPGTERAREGAALSRTRSHEPAKVGCLSPSAGLVVMDRDIKQQWPAAPLWFMLS